MKVEPSVTLPAALIATSCPTITLAMSADLLVSPINTCKFGGMGLSTTLRSLVSSAQTRSLRDPAEAPASECAGRHCRLRQEGRFSQPPLEFDHTGYQPLAYSSNTSEV